TTSTASVKMKVNGEVTRKLLEDQTDKLADGLEIGIRNLLGNEAGDVTQDLVEFYLGVDELIIEDTDIVRSGGGSLEVNDETISDANVEIVGTDDNTKVKVSKIRIRLAADDDLYIAEGKGAQEQLDDPEGFFTNNFDLEFQGLSVPDSTEIKLQNAGDRQYKLSFVNRDGTEYRFPLLSVISSGENRVGDDSSKKDLVYSENQSGEQLALTSYPIADEDSFIVNDNKALGVRQTGFTHILQYKDQDSTDNVLKFKDIGTGDTIEVSYTAVADSSDAQIIIGGKEFTVQLSADTDDANITVDLDGDGSINAGETPFIVVKGGVYLNFTVNGSFAAQTTGNLFNITVFADSDDIDDGSQEDVLAIPITVDTTPELDIGTIDNYAEDLASASSRIPSLQGYASHFQSGLHKVGSTDDRQERTTYGILVEQAVDTNGPDEVVLTVPVGQAEALVYVTANAPTITKTVTEGGISVGSQVTPIALGTAKLSSEVADVKAQNAIVVGGPCVNTAAASLMGNPADCTEGFEEGKAMVKLMEHSNGNVAMLVAGFSALDTRRAARVVAEGSKLAELDAGVTEVEVAGTTLTEATVSVPAPKAEAPAAEAEDAGDDAEADAGDAAE
ncbi:MAG: hypothetical protein QF535_18705, partial [Anaerolineales bacterium]|nr:hypothetical protein [Anaerolineales bacterium]